MTRKLIIEKPRGRLYFDDGYLRLDMHGMGLAIELSDSELIELEAAFRNCRRARKSVLPIL